MPIHEARQSKSLLSRDVRIRNTIKRCSASPAMENERWLFCATGSCGKWTIGSCVSFHAILAGQLLVLRAEFLNPDLYNFQDKQARLADTKQRIREAHLVMS